METEVWITGAGVISALGAGMDTHLQAVQDGRSGLKSVDFFDGQSPDPVICGMIPYDTLPLSLGESAANRADHILDIAFTEAKTSAGLSGPIENDIIIGTTLGNMYGATAYYQQLKRGVRGNVTLVQGFLSSSPGDYVSLNHQVTGKSFTVCSACASGATAIGQAYRRIRTGICDRVFAGGVDALSPFIVAGFHSLRLLSSGPCRPFDAERNGLNPGEGAAVLVLERAETAIERGAVPLARIAGFGEALEAYHQTRADPEGKGVSRAIEKGIQGVADTEPPFDHVHLHGTATEFNDVSEYQGLKRVLGDRLSEIPVCSTKSMTGHTFGGAGSIASVFGLLSLLHDTVPPTLHHEKRDARFELLSIRNTAIKKHPMRRMLVSTLGFGGEVAVLLYEKVESGND